MKIALICFFSCALAISLTFTTMFWIGSLVSNNDLSEWVVLLICAVLGTIFSTGVASTLIDTIKND